MIADWAAIGAIATLLGVVVAVMQLKRMGNRNTKSKYSKRVQYKACRVMGNVPQPLQEYSFMKPLGRIDSKITADQVRIRNASGRDIANVRIRLSRRPRIWDASLSMSTKLSEQAIKICIEGETVLISMEEFPEDELLVFDVVSNYWATADLTVRAENASIDLEDLSNSRRHF